MKRSRRGGALLVLVMMAVAACGGSGSPAVTEPPVAPAEVRAPLVLEERAEVFVDFSRPTEALGDAPAAPSRTLPTSILAPAAGQPGRPYPLIVFAHGSGGRGRGDHQLLRAWAAAGYVVAAPTFPFGGGRAPEGEAGTDLVNQPGDMSFVITEMLRLNSEAASPLHDFIDPNRIGAAGHSLGGMTTLGLAGNTCCYDKRLRAAAVLAGREMPFGRGEFWLRVSTPILFVHGEDDVSVPYADGRRAFGHAPPPRFLVTLIAGDHGRPFTGDADDVQARVVNQASLDFFDHYLKDVRGGLEQLRTHAREPGVARLESEL